MEHYSRLVALYFSPGFIYIFHIVIVHMLCVAGAMCAHNNYKSHKSKTFTWLVFSAFSLSLQMLAIGDWMMMGGFNKQYQKFGIPKSVMKRKQISLCAKESQMKNTTRAHRAHREKETNKIEKKGRQTIEFHLNAHQHNRCAFACSVGVCLYRS